MVTIIFNLLPDNFLVIHLLFSVWHFDPAKCSWNIRQQIQRPLSWSVTRTPFLISSPKVSCTTDISLVDELEDTEESLKEEEEGRASKSKVTREEDDNRATTSTVDQPVSRTVSPLERLKVTYQKDLFENITPIIPSGVQIRVYTFQRKKSCVRPWRAWWWKGLMSKHYD